MKNTFYHLFIGFFSLLIGFLLHKYCIKDLGIIVGIVPALFIALDKFLNSYIKDNYKNKSEIEKFLFKASKEELRRINKSNTVFDINDMDKSILPRCKGCCIKNNNTEIIELLERSNKSYIINGYGGMGKSISIFYFFNKMIDENDVTREIIPIFIKMSKPIKNDDWKKGEKTQFILYQIRQQLQQLNSDTEKYTVEDIEYQLTRKNEKKKYLLFLDGINELPIDRLDQNDTKKYISYRKAVKDEIERCINDYQNVRFIITSRKEEKMDVINIENVELIGIKEEKIIEYLRKKLEGVISENDLDNILKNKPKLKEILSSPLFINMFIKIVKDGTMKSEEKQKDKSIDYFNITTKGELLSIFFRFPRKDIYTQNINNKEISKKLNSSFTNEQISFITNIIVPAIYYKMVEKSTFSLNQNGEKANNIIEKELSYYANEYVNDLDTTILNETFEHIFDKNGEIKNITQIADELIKNDNYSKRIIRFITNTLCYLDENKTSVNQYYRDYFASIHYINKMLIGYAIYEGSRKINKDEAKRLSLEFLTKSILNQRMNRNIQILITEIIGEFKNNPDYLFTNDEDDAIAKKYKYLLENMLDIFRRDFHSVKNENEEKEEGKEHYIAKKKKKLLRNRLDIFRRNSRSVNNEKEEKEDNRIVKRNFVFSNIFEMIKLGRQDLSGMDLSYLDFQTCNLKGAVYGNGNVEGAKFDNSLIMDRNFYMDYERIVNRAIYSPDGNNILCVTNNGEILEYTNINSKMNIIKHDYHKNVSSAIYTHIKDREELFILSASEDGLIKIYNKKTKEENTIDVFGYNLGKERLCCAIYDINYDKILSVINSKIINEISLKDEVITYEYKIEKGDVKSVVYNKNGDRILLGLGTKMEIKNKPNKNKYEKSNDRENNIVKEIYIKEDNKEKIYYAHNDWVVGVAYSKDGTILLSTSDDGTTHESHILDERKDSNYSNDAINIYNSKVEYEEIWNNSVCYSPDGKRILTASDDGSIREWEVGNTLNVTTYKTSVPLGKSATYNPEGNKILSMSWDNTLEEYDVGDVESGRIINKDLNYDFIILKGCSFKNLYTDKEIKISEYTKKRIKEMGGSFS